MANMKVACLRKGVAAGRIGHALSELHIQVDVSGDIDLEVTQGALKEIKNSIKAFRKNFRASAEEVRAMDAGVKNVSKLLRKKPNAEALTAAKSELREIRKNFRKSVHTGFLECGSRGPYGYEIVHLINDNAYFPDTHPDHPTITP